MSKISAIKPLKISIALCTYNGAEFLPEQLESFRNQTRLPDEIIIGDDRSSDKTVEIIKDFAESVSFPVKLKINEENLGSTKNFEQTISRCTGDLIFLSDQDDVWLAEKIAEIEKEFEKASNVGLVFSDAELIDENSKPINSNLWDFSITKAELENIKSGKSFETLLRRNVITGATMAFRSRMRQKFIPIPDEFPNSLHDWWIALFCAIYSEIKPIEKPLIKYRQHGRQQIGVDWQRRQLKNLPDKFSQELSGRSSFYENSIKFSLGEIERIKKITQLLKDKMRTEEFDKFEKDSLEKLAEKFVSEKLDLNAHYKARKDLPTKRLKRIFPILREFKTGRYGRFSKGFLSAAKDLVEDWK